MRGARAAGLLALGWVLAMPGGVHAGCEGEARALRQHLETAERNAWWWNNVWRVTFAAAAAGQFVLGATRDDRDDREFFYVGATKASVATLSRLILPVSVTVPPVSADACADVLVLRHEVENTGRTERRIFWMSHISAIVSNTVGAIWLGERFSGSLALRSIAVSYPVGLLSIYTMPTASWHLWREQRARWALAPLDHGLWLGITGDF